MRIRPLVLLGGVFTAAALLAAFVISELPREGDVSPPEGPPPGIPAVARPTLPMSVLPTEADGVLEVRVTAGGEPQQGAAVRLYLASDSASGPLFLRGPEGTTGADGVVRLPACAGAWLVAARAPGLAAGHAAAVHAPRSPPTRVELALAPPVALQGQVTARGSGQPVAARLTALPAAAAEAIGTPGLGPAEELATATAGADGAFRLEGLAPGAWALRVEAAGFHERYVPRLALPRAAPAALTLEPSARLAGEVRRADGPPAKGTFAAAGSFAPGPGEDGKPVAGASPGEAGRIEGVVTDEAGRPLAGARVRVSSAGGGLPPGPALAALEARTDFEGRYRIDRVPAGRAELVALEDGAAAGDARTASVPPGAAVRVDLALPAPGALSGKVTAAGGAKPPLGTEVAALALRPGPRQLARTATDASGNFRFALPAGDYRVWAVPDPLTGSDARAAPAVVRVQAGRTTPLGLPLDTAPKADGPEVLVLEPGGAPSPGAEVVLGRPDGARAGLAAATGEDGRLALAREMGLSGRPVRISARSGGREGTWTGTLPDSGVVTVALRPGGAVSGRLVARGRAPRTFTVEVEAGVAPAPRRVDVHRFTGDRFELADLPAGPLHLTVVADDGRRGTADVRLAAGEVRVVDIGLGDAAPGRP